MLDIAPITVERFITEDFFTLLGLQSLSQKEKDEITDSLNKTVQARVFMDVYEKLTAEQQNEFDALPSEEIIPYLLKHDINLPDMIVEESLKYRLEIAKMYEGIVAPLQNSPVPTS